MAVTPNEIRKFLRDFEIPYNDEPEKSDDKDWSMRFWMPIKDYNFDERTGLSTNVNLWLNRNETDPEYECLRIAIYGIYITKDSSKIEPLLARINKINRKWAIVKWFLSTSDSDDGGKVTRVSACVEISLESDSVLTVEQFWRSHSVLWDSIQDTWSEFCFDLDIQTDVTKDASEIDFSQIAPEDMTDEDKEKILGLFSNYLDKTFENI